MKKISIFLYMLSICWISVHAQDEEGNPYHSTYHSSNVLIKVDGEWKAISSHVSWIKRE